MSRHISMMTPFISQDFNTSNTIYGAHWVLQEAGYCSCYNCLYGDNPYIHTGVVNTQDGRLLIECHKMEAWAIMFQFHGPEQSVYLHSPFDTINIQDPSYTFVGKYNIFIYFVAETILMSPEFQQLSIHQRKCRASHENNLKVSGWYSESMCRMQCRRDTAVRLCGCSPHVYSIKDGVRECGVADFPCLFNHTDNILSQGNSTQCKCDKDCGKKMFFRDSSTVSRNSKHMAFISYIAIETGLQEMIHYNDVTFSKLDMLLSWGGTVSFFMGCSLLNVVEIAYLLLRWPVIVIKYLVQTHLIKHMTRSPRVSRLPNKVFTFTSRLSGFTSRLSGFTSRLPNMARWMNIIFAKLRELPQILSRAAQSKRFMAIRVMNRLFSDYLEQSSVHGVKYIVRTNFSTIERVFWLGVTVAFLMMSSKLAIDLASQISIVRYEESISQTGLPFRLPAIFIQPRYVELNKTIKRIYGTSAATVEVIYRQSLIFPSHKSYLYLTSHEMCRSPEIQAIKIKTGGYLFCNIMNDFYQPFDSPQFKNYSNCTLHLKSCETEHGVFSCCDVFQLIENEEGPVFAVNSYQTHSEPISEIREARTQHAENGETFFQQYSLTMIFSNYIAKRRLPFEFKVLSPEEVPFLNVLQTSYSFIQSSNVFTLKVTNMKVDAEVLALDVEHRGCRMLHETDNDTLYPVYSYSSCVTECRARLMMKVCGCVHLYSPVRGHKLVCDLDGYACLEYKKDKLLSSNALKNCNCQPACQRSFIEQVGYSFDLMDQVRLQLKFVSSNKILHLRLNRGELDTFVTIGGMVGLFIGTSVISIVEFTFFFTVRFSLYLLEEMRMKYRSSRWKI